SGGERLPRHDLDELYGITLSAGIDAGTVILSGATSEDLVPTEIYRRLASDLRAVGSRVLVDLSGERLDQSLAGGVTVVKVADDELTDYDRAASSRAPDLITAMHSLVEEGAEHVIVTRAEESALMLTEGRVSEVLMPSLEVMDHHGAGDSLTAGVAAALADGATFTEGVTLGSAAGALNVTRHGLGSGNRDTVHTLRRLVEVRPYEERS
ncbi:MAG TPA: PfkB family carbohydrate kinase, partial [Brevibacterium sp.]|nr:PfkB family carbohydrate kinase [Brevibacterium sp.]